MRNTIKKGAAQAGFTALNGKNMIKNALPSLFGLQRAF